MGGLAQIISLICIIIIIDIQLKALKNSLQITTRTLL